MPRQKRPNNPGKEEAVTLSAEPVEPMPENPGEMTSVAAEAHREPEHREGKVVEVAEAAPPVKLKYYRVLADRRFMGGTGFRAIMRAGKEFSNLMYDPKKLRAQGVKFEEINEDEVAQF